MRRSLIIATGVWAIVAALEVAAQDRKANSEFRASVKSSAASDKAEHPLTAKCGPWMVMVKSFQGPEAVVYANKLASELRDRHKIVAYTFVKQPDQLQVQQVGYVRGRTRQNVSAAVLAGDCKNEKAAAKLQDQIQKLKPASITEDMVPKYQWQAGPLRTAFCLPNPLNKVPNEPDTKSLAVLKKLNAGKSSIFNCPGDFTLEAALFTGGIAYTAQQAKNFEKHSLLEAAGEHAEQVCSFLREKGYDAYTYHALTYSVVAVGSFDSPNDPQIEPLRKQIAGMNVAATNLLLSPNPALMKVPRQQN
jgi:hypothetical protein